MASSTRCPTRKGSTTLAAKGQAVAYVGYDCTAASLHVGHLLSIMMLHWLQETGNKPITLMGGGTTRVGDPSGRDESRKLLTYEQIDANKDSMQGHRSPSCCGSARARPTRSWPTTPSG